MIQRIAAALCILIVVFLVIIGVAVFIDDANAKGPIVDKKFDPAHTWVQQVPQYRLDCHPGPNNMTTCTSIFTHFLPITHHVPDRWFLTIDKNGGMFAGKADRQVSEAEHDCYNIGDWFPSELC